MHLVVTSQSTPLQSTQTVWKSHRIALIPFLQEQHRPAKQRRSGRIPRWREGKRNPNQYELSINKATLEINPKVDPYQTEQRSEGYPFIPAATTLMAVTWLGEREVWKVVAPGGGQWISQNRSFLY